MRSPRGFRAAKTCFVVAIALNCVACGPADDTADKSAPVTPPNCATVNHFGNGAACSSDDATLSACGAAKARVCANGRLCFDAAKLAFCGCLLDSDCVGRATYVNKMRAVEKIAPLGAKCVAGRCAGAP